MRRYAVRAALAAAGLVILAVAVQLWSVQRDLDRASATVRELSISDIGEAGGLTEALAPAVGAVGSAESGAEGPILDLVAPLPIVGEQVRGLRDVVDRVDAVVDTAEAEVRRVEAVLEGPTDAGTRVELTRTAIEAVDHLRRRLRQLEDIDRGGLLGPVRDRVNRFERRLADADGDLRELRARLETAQDLLVGPTRVLLLAANNAEHRAGMGMHLSAGVLTIRDGAFETSGFHATGRLTSLTEGRATVPEELDALFNPIWDFGREWRTTSTTPNFPVVGSIQAQLAEQSPIGPVDAVVSLDAPALVPLLEATGPVVHDDLEIDGGNVVEVLLKDNYLRLGDEEEANTRRQLQSEIARTIFDAITERDIDVITLAEGLVDAAEGRHLLGWSDDERIQSLWASIGATGELSPRSFLVSVQNATSSKRDYYLDPVIDVSPLGVADDGSRRLRIAARLENPIVEPTSEYVDSLNPLVPVGVHRAYVTFTLPDGTSDIDVRSGRLSRTGSDGPTEVAAVWIRIRAGHAGAATVDVTLPPGVDAVELVPSARVRPQVYEFGPFTVSDDVGRTLGIPYVDEHRPQEARPVAAAGLVTLFASLVLFVNRSRRLTGPDPDPDAARTDGRLARALLLLAVVMLGVAALG